MDNDNSSELKEEREEENEEQEDEANLVGDGFFENLMLNQKPSERRYEILKEDSKEMSEASLGQ